MYRNLANVSEFILWASASCGLAFFTRVFEAWFIPVALLRIAFTAYCIYNVYNSPKKSVKFSYCFIGGAVTFGLLGGMLDYLEIVIRYQNDTIIQIVTGLATILILFFVTQYWLISNHTPKNDD